MRRVRTRYGGIRGGMAATLVAASCLGTAACTGGNSTPTTTPTTATAPAPVGSSTQEQQAAADAKRAYEDYRRTVDRVFQRGGTQPDEELRRVASGKQLKVLTDEAAQFRTRGVKAVGSASVVRLTVERVSIQEQSALAVLNACIDASKNDAVDRTGKSVRRAGALNHFIETVTISKTGSGAWRVSEEDDQAVRNC